MLRSTALTSLMLDEYSLDSLSPSKMRALPTENSGPRRSGLLAGVPVSIVHTETDDEIRIISFRKATKREAKLYFSQIQD